ncbi:MAG TPA: hypothetical protein VF381_07685 [Thermoanaerobaculia bacterium]
MIEKALTFGGWPGLVLLLAGNGIGCLAWLVYMIRSRYRKAFYTLIMMFPFTFYAGRAAGIKAFEIPDFDQRIGLSTFLILVMYLVLLVRRRLRRPPHGVPRAIEFFFWVYAVTVTISQFATHDAFAAVTLSVGAAWEFLALFYIVISLIRRDHHVVALINTIFIFSLLNILVRVVAKGESLFVSLSSENAGDAMAYGADVGRVGSGALGPGASYAGYLAIFVTLALGMYFITRRGIYLGYAVMMLVEMVNTFTRGAFFVLGLLVLLVAFRRTRVITLKIAGLLLAGMALTWPILRKYIEVRGFSFNPMRVNTFYLRVLLTQRFFHEYQFSWWGNGILQQTFFELRPWLIVPIHNAYLEILDTCGILPFASFTIMTLLMAWYGFRVSVKRSGQVRDLVSMRLAPFVLITLLQWILFANTTSTSVQAYYPYEGIAIFWIVGTMPILIRTASRNAKRIAALQARVAPVRARPLAIASPTPAEIS